MLHETLKDLRKKKGYSQEEAASRLNVVRQTVSKWEKGLSVPDADMLLRISEVFEVPVQTLLGARIEAEVPQQSELVEQLARINEQLAVKNRRARKIWRTIAGVLIGLAVATLLLIVLSMTAYTKYSYSDETLAIEENAEIIDK